MSGTTPRLAETRGGLYPARLPTLRRLPPPDEDEFFLCDLVGLAAETETGQRIGTVRAVEDYGAGTFLIVDGAPERLIPFTRAAVPVVDIPGGRLVVVPPKEIIVRPEEFGDAA